MHVIVKSEGRRILEVAREALVKRGVAEESVIEIVFEGHPAEEMNKYVKDHAIDLIIIATRKERLRSTA